MPNFLLTNLVKAQALLNERFTRETEMRGIQSPVTRLGLANADLLIPGAAVLRTREDRPIEANMLARTKRSTSGAIRTYNHTGPRGDSFVMPIGWTQFVDKFSISVKMMDNNVFDYAQALANGFENCRLNLVEDIENFLVNYLFSQRTQVNIATKNGAFNATNHAFEISSATKDRYLQMARSMMRQNNYSGPYVLIVEPTLYANSEFIAAQGAANATNFGFQFMETEIIESVQFADPAYANGAGLMFPAGNFGVLTWLPRQNRQGTGNYDSYVGGYGTMNLPAIGDVALHVYRERADTSTMNGNEQDDLLQFELSIDISPNIPPLSVANESVIYEVAIA